MNRRQYVAGAAGAFAGLAGCVDDGPDREEIDPYEFSVDNESGSGIQVEVSMTRDHEPVFETELQMAPGETWEFDEELADDGAVTVIVVANGYSDIREWSNPTGANFLEANIREDGVEFTLGIP